MEYFVVYDTNSGELLKSGYCPAKDLSLQANEGQAVIITDSLISTIDYVYDFASDKLKQIQLVSASQIYESLNKSETELNTIIGLFLGTKDLAQINQWRFNNYKALRYKCYPSYLSFIDAQVKLSSLDPRVKEEGQEELDEYIQKCLEVKERFPK